MQLDVVILAAGKGTRMKSVRPKVLQPVGGRPMLRHVTDLVARIGAAKTHVVIGNGADEVRDYYARAAETEKATEKVAVPNWVVQAEQLGTGHAVQQAVPYLAGLAAEGSETDKSSKAAVSAKTGAAGKQPVTLVLYGDVPLMPQQTLADMVALAEAGKLALLTMVTEKPQGLGRILRDKDGTITGIVEDKDADPQQQRIKEINVGPMAIPTARLPDWLQRLDNRNRQKEYILTHIVSLAVADRCPIDATVVADSPELLGVNDKLQLATVERLYQAGRAAELMRAGVTLRDPARLDIRGDLSCGRDVEIDAGALFEGAVSLGDRVRVGAGAVLKDCSIGDDGVIGHHAIIKSSKVGAGARIEAATQVEGADIGPGAVAGPMARLRPGTVLAEGVHIGDFVETKNARIGKGSKANHLAYIGDAVIGADCNIGAGTVFCNYDGARKHQTTLGDRVFIGSNSTLVAPLTVADDAFVAAGSTVTREVPADNLAVARGRQRNINGWKRPCAE